MQLGESPSSLTTSPSPRLLRGSAVSAHAQIALGKHREQNRTSKLPVWSAELDHEAMQYTGVSQSTEVLSQHEQHQMIPEVVYAKALRASFKNSYVFILRSIRKDHVTSI